MGGPIQYLGPDDLHLIPGRGTAIGPHATVNFHRVIELEVQILQRFGSGDALRLSRTISQDEKGGFGEDAQPVDPTAYEDFLLKQLTEGVDEGTLDGDGSHSRISSHR